MDNLQKIVDKANELGHLLRQNEIVRRYVSLAEQIEKSETSKDLIEEYMEASQEYAMKERTGGTIEVAEKRRLQELDEKVRADPLIPQFLATQGYYLQIMAHVNDRISNPQGEPPRESNIILPGEKPGLILP